MVARRARGALRRSGWLVGFCAAGVAVAGVAAIDCGGPDSTPASLGDSGSDSQASPDTGVADAAPVDGASDASAAPDAPSADGAADATPSDTSTSVSDAGTDSDTGLGPEPDGGIVSSCAAGGAGMTNCGNDGGESCCASWEVGGGTYDRSYEYDDAGSPTGEADPATVSSFRLDKYLVTVGRFRQFVNALYPAGTAPDAGVAWTPSVGSGKHTHLNGGLGLAVVSTDDGGTTYEPGWTASDDANVGPTNAKLGSCAPYSTWTDSPGAQENLPINCLEWAEAYAFCIWDGGFLPSEAEWEYAAAGGSEQRQFPWGSTPPGTNNEYAIYSCYYGYTPAACYGFKNFAPVGTASLGAGKWGQLDLAGEVWEWTLDSFGGAYPSPCTDCVAVSPTGDRVVRGGDIFSSALLLPSIRNSFPLSDYSEEVGFRCARTP